MPGPDQPPQDDLPPYGDWDDLPEETKLTAERIDELLEAGAPDTFARYRELLEARGEDRCRIGMRGLGGFYWPCTRPTEPGERYCFAHGGRSPEATEEERKRAQTEGALAKPTLRIRLMRLIRRGLEG